MTNIRRYPHYGRPVFLTLVCKHRQPLLLSAHCKNQLLEIIRQVKQQHPFRMQAWVILDDHIHLLISLENEDLSKIVQKIKLRFSREMGIAQAWQRRFWDHICRDADDVSKHMDYIHYNPVKHGFATSAEVYPWSSFHYYVQIKMYPKDWGCRDKPGSDQCVGNE